MTITVQIEVALCETWHGDDRVPDQLVLTIPDGKTLATFLPDVWEACFEHVQPWGRLLALVKIIRHGNNPADICIRPPSDRN